MTINREAFKDALASAYGDYVRKKQDKGEKALSEEEWERKTQGGGGETSDAKDMGAIERLRKKRKENPMGKKPSAIDKKKSKERYLELSKKRREKMKQKALSKKRGSVPNEVVVRWDLGEGFPHYSEVGAFKQAAVSLGLPLRVKLSKDVIALWENEGRDNDVIDQFLSDAYGYLHHGWKAASVADSQELEAAWGINQTKTARESRLVQKVKAMSVEERKKLPPYLVEGFEREQYVPAAEALVRKIARFVADEINKEASKLDIFFVSTTTGDLYPHPYKDRGLLKATIPELIEHLDDMI